MLDAADKHQIYQHIGHRLRALREERGLRQAEVADLIGKSHQTYSNYEKADNHVTLDALYVLARHYGVPLEELLPDDTLILSLLPGSLRHQPSRGVSEAQEPFDLSSPHQDDRLGDAAAMSALILRVRDAAVRKDLLQLVETLSKR